MAVKRRVVAVLIIVLVQLGWCSSSLLPISLSERQNGGTGYRAFVDSDGRQRFFHGINAVVKGPPWLPSIDGFDTLTSMVSYDMDLLSSLGLNIIRLGVMWPGVQPTAPWEVTDPKQTYDEDYLDRVQFILDQAGAKNIYVLLDMHQDVLSERFCGEGIPLWAANLTTWPPSCDFPWPLGPAFSDADYEHSSGYALPTRQACERLSWGDYYFAESASSAFQQLYQNSQNLTNLWGQALAHVAKRFAGHPAVLGLELINEPWTGNVYQHPELLDPKYADAKLLQPSYQTVASIIREQNDDILLFFEGVTWADTGFGFTDVPGGASYANRSVLSFHYYTPPQLENSQQYDFSVHIDEAASLGCGYMLTETCTVQCDADFVSVMQTADQLQLSWAAWEWKNFCRESNDTIDGASQWAAYGACKTGYGGVDWQQNEASGAWAPSLVDQMTLGRAFPIAVAGRVVNMSFVQDPANYTAEGPFSLVFAFDPSCSLPTEIYIPQQWSSSSNFQAQTSPDLHLTVTGNILSFTPTISYTQGTIITITVSPLATSSLI